MSYRSFALFSADSPHQVSPMHPAPWRDPPVLNDLETAVVRGLAGTGGPVGYVETMRIDGRAIAGGG